MNLNLRGVSAAFDATRALNRIDLSVTDGEAVGIVGPSGSGKTTLLRLLNGSVRPTEGTVLVDGVDLAQLDTRAMRRTRGRIGFVHQDFALVPNMPVLQNVLTGRLGRRGFWGSARDMIAPGREVVREVHGLLERVGIAQKLYQRVDTLSGGQAQRVAIARALFQKPAMLLADEPVSSVDPARARDTLALLAEVGREEGLTLCVSLHNLELAREFFPRLIGLRKGRVVFDRTTAELAQADFANLYELADEEMLK